MGVHEFCGGLWVSISVYESYGCLWVSGCLWVFMKVDGYQWLFMRVSRYFMGA